MSRIRLIGATLGIFALFGLVAAALFLPVQQQTQAIDDAVISARVQSVEASASGLRVMLQGAKAQADLLARSLEPWSGSNRQKAEARGKLDAAQSGSGIFDGGIYISTPEGVVVATSNDTAALLSLPRPSGFLGSASVKTIMTGVFQDPLIQVPILAAASPIHDGAGNTTGILVAMIGAKSPRVLALLENLPFKGDIQAYIVDPDGQALNPGRPEGVDRSNEAAQTLRRRATSILSGSTAFEGPGGIAAIGAWANAEDGWVVVAHQGSSQLLESTKGPMRSTALALGGLALVAALALTAVLLRLRSARGESNRVKRAFLAIAGHELRTPLTAIRGFSQTMEGRWEKLTDEQRKQMLSTIARQARNLENLVERLLLGAQLEAGIKQSPSLRETDVTEAIEKAVGHQRAQAPLHTFDLHLDPPLVAKVDTKGLNQVLTQLLENAVKYSPSGGTVWVAGRKVPGGVELTVEDEGVGLPSDITKIFDKFGQGESVDTRVYDEGGVGLGLFIARRHLEMMRGSVRAERRQPAGARFVVRLPA